MFGFFVAVFLYVVIHEQVTFDTLQYYWLPQVDSLDSILATVRTALLMAGVALGPGWGSIITLSSYNNFRSDAERLSFWVCLTHITIGLMGLLCCNVAHDHFEGGYKPVVGSGLSSEHREVLCPSSARSRITYMFV